MLETDIEDSGDLTHTIIYPDCRSGQVRNSISHLSSLESYSRTIKVYKFLTLDHICDLVTVESELATTAWNSSPLVMLGGIPQVPCKTPVS